MSEFDPADNVVIALYGPPEYFETLTNADDYAPEEEELSFFGKLLALFRRLIDFLKGLFNR